MLADDFASLLAASTVVRKTGSYVFFSEIEVIEPKEVQRSSGFSSAPANITGWFQSAGHILES